MKLLGVAVVSIFASSFAFSPGQIGSGEDLAQLMSVMPSQVHSKQFDLLTFSRAVEPAIGSPSADLTAAIPVCARDLSDTDPEVRKHTMAVLSGVAARPDGSVLLSPLFPQLNLLLTYDRDDIKALTLLTVSNLGARAPDTSIAPIEQILANRHDSIKLTVGAAESLMRMRPKDDGVQSAVLEVMNDGSLDPSLRARIVFVAGQPGAGDRVVDDIALLVNKPADKELRDAAISASTNIGAYAVAKIQVSLSRIANDANESAASRSNAARALRLAVSP